MRPLIVGLVLASLAGCTPRFDPDAETQKLLARDAEWAGFAAGGTDVERTVSYWADDAVIIPQGQSTIEGKAAIRSFVRASFHTPGFHIRWKSAAPTFSADGTLAYMRSESTTTVPGAGGAPTTLHQRGMTVWRRDTDGEWSCVVDVWNDPPAR